MGTTTRIALMQRMADALGLRLNGTLSTSASTAGTSTVFEDTAKRWEQDDYLNEGYVILNPTSSSAAQERRISDFANATARGTIYGTWSTTVSSGASYDIYRPPVTPDQYRSAITAACSKLTARGLGRRHLDTSLVTTFARRYAVPSGFDARVNEAYIQPVELIANNLWIEGESGWTLSSVASLTNDGTNGERTLKLAATSATQRSYVDVDVTPLEEYEFFAPVKSDGTVTARWMYQVSDSSNAAVVAYTVIGTAVTASSWTQQTGVLKMPANASRLRLAFDASAASTVYTQGPNLMRYGAWERVSGWRPEYDTNTAYLLLPATPHRGRRLKLVGSRTLEVPATDWDSISIDEPEIVALTELACAEAWRQFGAALGVGQTRVDTEIKKHEDVYREVAGQVAAEWRPVRQVRSPRFGALH